jgi:hypothetical protein
MPSMDAADAVGVDPITRLDDRSRAVCTDDQRDGRRGRLGPSQILAPESDLGLALAVAERPRVHTWASEAPPIVHRLAAPFAFTDYRLLITGYEA